MLNSIVNWSASIVINGCEYGASIDATDSITHLGYWIHCDDDLVWQFSCTTNVFLFLCQSHILSKYLHTSFRQIDLHRQVLPGEHVRIVSLSKCRFELFQLLKRERCSIASLFSPYKRFIVYGRVIWITGICNESNHKITFI